MFSKFRSGLFLFVFFSVFLLYTGTVSRVSGSSNLYPAATVIGDEAGLFTCIVTGIVIAFLVITLFYIIHLKKRLSSALMFSKSINENAKAMIIICDSDGRVVLFNKFAQEITGHGRRDAEGKKIDEIPFLNSNPGLGKQIYECIESRNNVQNLE
ncbi:MAG: PAS domain S-box protein, partial [Bacillota bacterium]